MAHVTLPCSCSGRYLRFWILAANSWMQTPGGTRRNGIAIPVMFQVIFIQLPLPLHSYMTPPI